MADASRSKVRVSVAAAADIAPGEVRLVKVEDRSIGIFNVRGRFFALANKCPHAGAPVCRGLVTGRSAGAAPGDRVTWGCEGEILRCPWHAWEFDIATGRSLTEPTKRIPSYPVSVEDGRIVVEVRRGRDDDADS